MLSEVLVIPAGTVTFSVVATVSVTVSPFFTSELGGGSVEMTVPGASEEICAVSLTTRPSAVSLEVAYGHRLTGDRPQVEGRTSPQVAEVAGQEVPGHQ